MRIDHNAHVRAAYFFPVRDLAAENCFELFARKFRDRIGRVHYYGQRVEGYRNLDGRVSGRLQFHPFVEFHAARGHGNVDGAFPQR